jgi:RNA polymerase sigma-70 factor (ECF subfamily)
VTMSEPISVDPRPSLEQVLIASRAKLHRYCARMTGSALDGEDVVQEVLLKVMDPSLPWETLVNPEAWLFRVAHNTTLDFLRRRARENAIFSGEDPDAGADESLSDAERQEITAASLQRFMQLPSAQRSCVILMDVLGYSLREVSEVAELSVPAVKAALHRGRKRLRELADAPELQPTPALSRDERRLLAAYIDRFNAAEVSTYFSNYSRMQDWHMASGYIEELPAILVYPPIAESQRPSYFVLLQWRGGKVVAIRDFRHARYAVESARFARV